MVDAALREDRVLDLVRIFNAPRDLVFRAWTEPEMLTKWWGPKGMKIPEYTMDVREGGKWRTVMRNAEGGEHIVGGQYKEISPPDRLVFTWAWETEDSDHQTTVTIEFHEDGNKTRMVFHQELFESKQGRDNHNGGWASSFECLDEIIASGALD